MIEVVATHPDHIGIVAENMRAIDRRECGAFGQSPLEALAEAVDRSLWSLTALKDGVPHAIMGVVPRNMIEGHGIPWFLGTDQVYTRPVSLIRFGKVVIAEMRGSFTTLENFVSVENDRAIRFLRHFGWDISEETYSIGGVEFVRFG